MIARLAFVTLTFCASAIHARSIEWASVESDAFLDGQGRLHITEVQAIVFDGDWNGGERLFPLPASRLDIESLTQVLGIDRLEKGAWVPLKFGNLERVDHYDYEKLNGRLRWALARIP